MNPVQPLQLVDLTIHLSTEFESAIFLNRIIINQINISWSKLLECQDLTLLCVLHDCKLNNCVFWRTGWTQIGHTGNRGANHQISCL